MVYFPVDPEEMAKRTDGNIDAILQMIEEGSPIFESYTYEEDGVFKRKKTHQAGEELPETYQ